MTMAEGMLSDGRVFPPGRFELLPHHIWLWTDAVLGDQVLGALPSVACFVALSGAGISIQGLMDELRTEPRHVMFGEIDIDLSHPLRAGATYEITTRIDGIERKQGRRIAVFDRVSIVYQLIEEDVVAATVIQGWIVSRPSAEDPS